MAGNVAPSSPRHRESRAEPARRPPAPRRLSWSASAPTAAMPCATSTSTPPRGPLHEHRFATWDLRPGTTTPTSPSPCCGCQAPSPTPHER
jgi:hypothetical protein